MTNISEDTLLKELEELKMGLSSNRGTPILFNPQGELDRYKETIEEKISSGFDFLWRSHLESNKNGNETIPFFEEGKLSDLLSLSIDDATLEKLYNLVSLAFDQKEWGKAHDALFLLLLFRPDHPLLLFAMGEVEFALGQFVEARALYTSAYIFNNSNTDALERILLCCSNLGDTEGVLEIEQLIKNHLNIGDDHVI